MYMSTATIRAWFKRLFCRHFWKRTEVLVDEDSGGFAYGEVLMCSICGKEKIMMKV